MSFWDLYSVVGDAAAINRGVGIMNGNYLARSLFVYKSSVPPEPATLKRLIDEYDRANDRNDTSITSTAYKISMMRGPDKRDHALVLVAKIISEQKDAGKYENIAPLLEESTLQGENGNTFWVFLFKKAALKYSGYWSSNTLHAITSDVAGATPEEKYQNQTAAVIAKLNEDFFSDAPSGPKFAEFQKSYKEYKTNNKFTGGGVGKSSKKRMRGGRRGTHKLMQKKHARKSIRRSK